MPVGSAKLILFARHPEPGRVKTRLIPALGAEGAARLHRRLVLRSFRMAERACESIQAGLEIRFDGGSEEDFHHWLGDRFVCRPQKGGDLGARMAAAFAESFGAGSHASVIVGSDCPGLTAELLAEAFEKLASYPAVLGPATDGGYYLIGLRAPIPELFQGVAWGTDKVLHQSLEILAGLNHHPALLPPLDDIDRPEDVRVWQQLVNAEDSNLRGVSVIIPALNESKVLSSTLEPILSAQPAEVILVDGGSTDGTAEIAQRAGVNVLHSKPGRARQMNAGAAKAAGAVLLFVHADTVLSAGWESVVSSVLQDARVAAGAFGFRVADKFPGNHLLQRAVNCRSRWFQLPYGDQALFLRRALFEELGGFACLPIMEDYEIVRRLRRHGRIVTSTQPATTSGRRWRRFGLFRVTLRNQLIIAGFRLGVPPHRLADFSRGKNHD